MSVIILPCCGNPKKFCVAYATGSVYHVCATCINLPHWGRNIKTKEVLN